MPLVKLGPDAARKLSLVKATWKQGEHVLITGGTGSGKTLLARYLDQMRIGAGGSVVVFIAKLQPDKTITDYYAAKDGWVRWKKWRKPSITDRKILLWPAVEGKTYREAITIMKEVFQEALSEISKTGLWTIHIDEGLMMTDRESGLGFASDIATMYALMRSAKGTMITLSQRPMHLPLSIYANLSWAFIGKAKELADVKRLANLDGSLDSRALALMIRRNGIHDFVMVPIAQNRPPERINLAL
jgi:ABC-type oligopeptide transport system ATPase subunit